MQTFIGTKLLSSKAAQPANKPFEIYDSRLHGFTLRVQPTGVRSYYARFGRNRRYALGKVGALQPDEARDRCQQVLGNVAQGRPPLHGLNGEGLTLGQFIHDAAAVGRAHCGPTGDLVDSAAATEADPGTGIERADFEARAFDHQTVSSMNLRQT